MHKTIVNLKWLKENVEYWPIEATKCKGSRCPPFESDQESSKCFKCQELHFNTFTRLGEEMAEIDSAVLKKVLASFPKDTFKLEEIFPTTFFWKQGYQVCMEDIRKIHRAYLIKYKGVAQLRVSVVKLKQDDDKEIEFIIHPGQKILTRNSSYQDWEERIYQGIRITGNRNGMSEYSVWTKGNGRVKFIKPLTVHQPQIKRDIKRLEAQIAEAKKRSAEENAKVNDLYRAIKKLKRLI